MTKKNRKYFTFNGVQINFTSFRKFNKFISQFDVIKNNLTNTYQSIQDYFQENNPWNNEKWNFHYRDFSFNVFNFQEVTVNNQKQFIYSLSKI